MTSGSCIRRSNTNGLRSAAEMVHLICAFHALGSSYRLALLPTKQLPDTPAGLFATWYSAKETIDQDASGHHPDDTAGHRA